MKRFGLALVVLVTACGGQGAAGFDAALGADAGVIDAVASAVDSGSALIDDRPYGVVVPDGYDPAVPTPLVIVLHGYGATGALYLAYFGLEDAANTHNFLLAYPDGVSDGVEFHFWNATNACCNFTGVDVDDVAYLNAVIDDMAAQYNVDETRVYLIGHSNGGFMAHRMACDSSSKIAAIVSLAGAGWADPSQCDPSEPVAILQVHGVADTVILYEGGAILGNAYPSAPDTVGDWGVRNGCDGDFADTGIRLDLVPSQAGDETTVEAASGCPSDAASVELWSIGGGEHSPGFALPGWPDAFVEFLYAHPKQ